jgi:hypothetical protein
MRQLAVAQFVQDFARLGVAVVVAHFRLKLPQHLQRPSGEFRIDDHRLQRDDQGVPAEQRYEPRQPGSRHEHHVVHAPQRQPEGSHVLHTLIVAAIRRTPDRAPPVVTPICVPMLWKLARCSQTVPLPSTRQFLNFCKRYQWRAEEHCSAIGLPSTGG